MLASVASNADILLSTASIGNNVSTPTSINGFAFSPTTVRGAVAEFVIYRVSTGVGAEERVETGTLHITYKSTAATFEMVQTGAGSSGVTLTITTGGQIQYVSDSMLTTYTAASSVIRFRARTLPQ